MKCHSQQGGYICPVPGRKGPLAFQGVNELPGGAVIRLSTECWYSSDPSAEKDYLCEEEFTVEQV